MKFIKNFLRVYLGTISVIILIVVLYVFVFIGFLWVFLFNNNIIGNFISTINDNIDIAFSVLYLVIFLVVTLFLFKKKFWNKSESLLFLIISLVIWASVFVPIIYINKNNSVLFQKKIEFSNKLQKSVYKIDKVKANFVDLDSDNPRYEGQIYLSNGLIGLYEYEIVTEVSGVKVSTIKGNIELSKNQEFIPFSLSLKDLAWAWIDKRMNTTNTRARFDLRVGLTVKLRLLKDKNNVLINRPTGETKRFVSEDVTILIDYGKVAFKKK